MLLLSVDHHYTIDYALAACRIVLLCAEIQNCQKLVALSDDQQLAVILRSDPVRSFQDHLCPPFCLIVVSSTGLSGVLMRLLSTALLPSPLLTKTSW